MEEGQGRRDSNGETEEHLQAEGSGKSEGSPVGAEGQDSEGDPAGRKAPSKNGGRGGKERPGRATGPRTRQGKNRSRWNSLKHRMCRAPVLEGCESKRAYHRFLRALLNDMNPRTTLGAALVEQLAADLWRLGRFYEAEAAEILKAVKFLKWDREKAQEESAQMTVPSWLAMIGGLIGKRDNPLVLARIIEALGVIQERVRKRGFDQEEDLEILTTIYGIENNVGKNMVSHYRVWMGHAKASEGGRQEKESFSSAQCRDAFVKAMDDELHRLREYQTQRARIESERMELEQRSRRVPQSPTMDRLLRYKLGFERSCKRTLEEIEMLRRMDLF